MEYYIGLDAHASSTTGVVVDKEGRVTLRETFSTTEGNLSHFIDRIQGERNLTFEESHLSQWLYLLLNEKVENLLVCNPVYVAKKPGAKTDFRDALHLAQELRGGHLQGVYHDESHWIQLRTLMSGYLDIVGEIVRCKNRLKAVFRSEALCTRSNQFYSQKERATELSHDSARFVAEQFFDHIEYLENRKKDYKYWFKENKNKYRPIRNLMTIPGINLVRANIITAIVCMPHRFKNKHQFWGYCMLVRHIQQSGGRIYGNKRAHGRGELRNAFIGAAENAMRSNSCLRDYYDALRARGVKHKEAKLALARHIASIALSLLKNNETYQDDYLDKQRERTKLRKTLNLNRH